MTDPSAALPLPVALAAAALPLLYLAAALAAGHRSRIALPALWRGAEIAAAAALAVALLVGAGALVAGGGVHRFAGLEAAGAELHLSVRVDAIGSVMLVLVTFIGLVIFRYSRCYLGGDPRQGHYIRWFMATLAAVGVLTVANNLLLLAAGWILSSVALHQLLTHFDDRPQALIAAHKKFFASRVGDLAMLAAIYLVGSSLGTVEVDRALTAVGALEGLPASLEWAAVLFAIAAVLKCAQLPFHGWLIQVMEAPTPVSALLHAGVVNIGGFLMIRMSPLMVEATAAQTLLVVVGSLTAAIAALTMMTRISIKVMLAWSTCAQMGFMLMQCGLGVYELAALHLVAHSLYKAHAFLASGSVVEQYRLKAMAPAGGRPAFGAWVVALAVASAVVAGVAAAVGVGFGDKPALWALAAIVTVALTPLLVRAAPRFGWAHAGVVLGASALVSTLYFTAHALLTRVPVTPMPVDAGPAFPLVAWTIAVFALLFTLHAWISAHPAGRLSQSLYPHLYAGLYLDELFTRLTFRLWPARLRSSDRPRTAHLQPRSVQS